MYFYQDSFLSAGRKKLKPLNPVISYKDVKELMFFIKALALYASLYTFNNKMRVVC